MIPKSQCVIHYNPKGENTFEFKSYSLRPSKTGYVTVRRDAPECGSSLHTIESFQALIANPDHGLRLEY